MKNARWFAAVPPVSIGSSLIVPNSDPASTASPWEIPCDGYVVRLVPILENNYVFLLIQGNQAVAVDPGQAEPVLHLLEARKLELTDIWITHGHRDHIGGVSPLMARTGARLTAPAGLSLSRVDHVVEEGSQVSWGQNRFQVWSTPGHQRVHVSYLDAGPNPGSAFIGDVLFGGGCGRLFGNPPALLLASHRRLQNLPEHCRLFCAHEFTLDNLAFALTVEPGNEALRQRWLRAQARRARGEPTVPLNLPEERATNPFLRLDAPEVLRKVGLSGANPVDVFAALRALKDDF